MDTQSFARSLVSLGERVEGGGTLSGEELGAILKRLTALEVQEGGPYAMRGGRADLCDNLAVAYFLRSLDVRLPQLDAYIQREWKRKRVRSDVERDLKKRLVRLDASSVQTRTAKPLDREERVLRHIRERAAREFQDLGAEIRKHAIAVMERTIAGNPDRQMSLMAYFTRDALGSRGKRFSDEHVAMLGLANIFFWSAFIVYDDFWDDDEAAKPIHIPVANLFSRSYTDIFLRLLPETTGFRRYFHATMDALDSANAWELAACRMRVEGPLRCLPKKLPAYGDFGIKFYPAAGHVMGPVSMLVTLGYHALSSEVRAMQEYFRHYLIAMQLNDDAHDWKEDLERGHISTAVYLLLKKWRATHPNSESIHIQKDMPELERMYWFEVIQPLCKAVLSHTQRSKDALDALTSIVDAAPLEQFITRNARVAQEALGEYERSTGVVRSFSTRILKKS